MTDITQLIRSNPILDKEGRMVPRFYDWTQQVTQMQVLMGAGSPEGVVEAPITTLYMNTAGTAGSILYVKRDTDVTGDRTKGWILV